MNEDIIKQRFQRWVVTISVLLLVGKFVAFWITNSVGVFTDAMESIVNVAAGFISLFSLHWAAKPRDKQHPFGHGKIELVSASIEGIMIAVAGGLIVYEGIMRIFTPAEIQKLDVGIVIIAVAGLVNFLIGAYSVHMGRKYNSIALVAGGKHLQSDTYSTIGLIIGLLLLYFTNIEWIDGALAIIFGGIILFTGFSILRKTVANLLDKADTELLGEIAQVANQNRQASWIDIHNTKTIKYGSYIFVDCDLTLPWFYNIQQSHVECDKLTEALEAKYGNRVQMSVHSDPCDERFCSMCALENCDRRRKKLVAQKPITKENMVQTDAERQDDLSIK